MQVEDFYQSIKQNEQSFIDNADPKIQEEADQWNKEIREREHYSSFRELIGEVLDTISKKADQWNKEMGEREQYFSFEEFMMGKLLGEERDEVKIIGRKTLHSGVQAFEILFHKFCECLDNPEKSMDHCFDSAMLTLVLLNRDEQIVDSTFKGLVQPIMGLRERIVEERLIKLEELKKNMQGEQPEQEEVKQQEE